MLGMIGIGVLVALVALGVFVGLVMLAIGAVSRLASRRHATPARKDDALDADFRVVSKSALPAP